ncbi:MAG: hypothetical protein SFV54_19845 [Bryobacteraceae bacterium]|nr:hypothetical protein [Bryobacteraceae bacterium]
MVRDTSGRLLFVANEDPLPHVERIRVEEKLASVLGPYARPDGVLTFRGDLGVQRLLQDPGILTVTVEGDPVCLLDRRIVGSAWLEAPREHPAQPPRLVFASMKGGVGRSTALALTASDLARRNQNVLIVDLDLEAPGIGGMLLDDERAPRFGTIDYLLENGLRPISDEDLGDFLATSALTTAGSGRVDIVPALGRSGLHHPENTLGKVARAMIEDIEPQGGPVTLASQMEQMIAQFVRLSTYDAVLIDSRAGWSEVAAPAILSLGAAVLFFGTAQQQTVRGYASLFAALKPLALRARLNQAPAGWRFLFKAVLAKAAGTDDRAAWYRDEMYGIFAENLYDEDDPNQLDDRFTFGIDESNAPHWPLVIPFDAAFADFDPVRTPTLLSAPFYEHSYRPFLNGIDTLLASTKDNQERTENES